MHRFAWDLRGPPPHSFSEELPISAVPHDTPRVPQGALVVPGHYTVRLAVDGTTLERPLAVAIDPRVTISPSALAQQYSLSERLVTLMDRTYAQAQAAKAAGNAKGAAALSQINDRAASLLDTIDGADAPPTSQAIEAVQALEGSK
jgi:hypothetical protein